MCVFYPKCQWCNWHLSFVAMLHTSGKESKASPTASSSQEGEECAQEEREEAKQVLEPVSHSALVAELRKQVATPLERCHGEALSSSEAAMHNAKPRVDLLNILQQGWDLRSVCSLGCCSCWLLLSSSSLTVFSCASLCSPPSIFITEKYECTYKRRWEEIEAPLYIGYVLITFQALLLCTNITAWKPGVKIHDSVSSVQMNALILAEWAVKEVVER